MPISPVRQMIYGFLLLLVGFLAAFAMVLRLVEASFLLSFVSYGASLVGLILGLFGVTGYAQRERSKTGNKWDEP